MIISKKEKNMQKITNNVYFINWMSNSIGVLQAQKTFVTNVKWFAKQEKVIYFICYRNIVSTNSICV